jgi:hypothetical protein
MIFFEQYGLLFRYTSLRRVQCTIEMRVQGFANGINVVTRKSPDLTPHNILSTASGSASVSSSTRENVWP